MLYKISLAIPFFLSKIVTFVIGPDGPPKLLPYVINCKVVESALKVSLIVLSSSKLNL